MEPARNNLTTQLQNFSNQLREIDQDSKLDSPGKFFKKEEKVYAPLRQILNSVSERALSEPGVRESLKELKQIIKADSGVSKDITDKIKQLSKQSKVAPTPSDAEQDITGTLAGMIGELQRGVDDPQLLRDIDTLFRSDVFHTTPHPEVQVLLKSLITQLKNVDPKSLVIKFYEEHLVEEYEREPYRGSEAMDAHKRQFEYEVKEAASAHAKAQQAKVDAEAAEKKSQTIMSNQFLKYFQQEIRELINKKDDKNFAFQAQRYAQDEFDTHSMDVLLQLPPGSKKLIEELIDTMKSKKASPYAIEPWEDIHGRLTTWEQAYNKQF
ncbi:MAG: hypothetical protein LLG04_07960 [Parachlamydia sp.]|nr:hypothetical protein [Parachlamydia sp.]